MAAQRFAGQVALVTGGANGLGRAITSSFVAEGARVVIVDMLPPPEIDAENMLFLQEDVAAAGAGERAVAAAVERWGKVDILVNDAAAYPNALMIEMPLEEWTRVFDVNVHGAFGFCQAFARHCIAREASSAHIVSISTGSARSPRPAGGAYSASKAALETLSRVLAMELGPRHITVNVVAPGYIDVRGWSDAQPDRAPEDLRAALVRAIPLGEAGSPDDIAQAVLFLCSDAARHINGTVLEVDGGSSAGRFVMTR